MKHNSRLLRILLWFALLAMAFGPSAWTAVEPNGLVILFTDYGADSLYVGMLKGAIYAKAPNARIDTLTNSAPPFDAAAGAYLLAEGCLAYPSGTTFCCVVDPGVGTARKCLALETKAGQFFVGPDNGLFTRVVRQFGVAEQRECTNQDLWRAQTISETFHGRDIFGPVAAALATGVPTENVGPPVKSIVMLDLEPSRVEDGAACGKVVRIDPYGNVVTNITADALDELGVAVGDTLSVTVGDAQYTAPFAKTYASVPKGKRVALLQSSGFVECAANMASLAEMTGAQEHAPVTIRKAE